jgi:hypothetical protein
MRIAFSGSDTLEMGVCEWEYCGAEMSKVKSPSYI